MTYTPPPPREPERQVFHIYVDEFQNFATERVWGISINAGGYY
jgi:hypothetical protein